MSERKIKTVVIKYTRPETDEEMAERADRERQAAENKERFNRTLLEELKRKYEPT